MLTDKIKELISSNTTSLLGGKEAKIIAICSQKGGVGKTTTAVNLGAALAEFNNSNVLIIDLDPQGHVEKSLGATIPEGADYKPLSQTLTTKKPNILESVVATKIELLHITPGDHNLYETEGVLASKIGREFILNTALKSAKNHFDYIVIDCPPNLGTLTINALCTADYVVVPCEMSVLAFEGVADLLNTVETVNERLNTRLKVLGVLFTRVDGRNVTMNQLIEENLRGYFKGYIFKNRITVNTDLNKAQLEGLPVFDFAPSSTGATNYHALADEILKRIKKI